MDVLIAGAGIGGLVAALALHDAGFDRVAVVESAPVVRPVGAGLNLLPNAVRELAALGLYRAVAARAVNTTEVRYHTQRGELIVAEPRGRSAGWDWPQLSVRRGDLQSALLEAVRTRFGPRAVRTGVRVTGVDGQVVRAEHNGRAVAFRPDVLVGADGIHSAVRRALTGPSEPTWCNTVVWRGMTWSPPPHRAGSMIIAGDGERKVVVYAVTPPRPGDGRVLLNWAASLRTTPGAQVDRSDWNTPVPAAKFAPGFAGWMAEGLDLAALFEGADGCFEYPMVDREPLTAWTRGTTTLVGDAAHPMAPMGSNATTQAVVDGRALAYFLATADDPAQGLLAYEAHRRPVTTRVQLANRVMGPEVVIDLVAALAPDGFGAVGEVLPPDELRGVGERYAALAAFDRGSANARSPYDVRRARLVGAATHRA
ncbi:FAD-dependent monooxygenase [Actinokineospora sp. G85]|uniref:FAD-dependent monooxygenase n=1 Tax=Actinokineospora sp. G85 TaxID=3406626 RepID=UPI003C71F2E7